MADAKPSKLSVERSLCPRCGRETQTTSDGVCVECWNRKRSGPEIMPTMSSPSRERGFFQGDLRDFLADLLEVDHGSIVLVGALVVVLAVLAKILFA